MVWWSMTALGAAPTAAQVASMVRVQSAVIAPDGASAVYVAATPTPPAEGEGPEWTVTKQLWLVRGLDQTPTEPRRITAGDTSASSPAFSPDGRSLAFLRAHDDHTRLYVLPLDGGEALPVDTGELEPSSFTWSPDSLSFAFTAPEPESKDEAAARDRDGDVQRVGEFEPDHLYLVPRSGGAPTRAADTDRHVVSVAFAPNGQQVAVVTAPSSDPYDAALAEVGVVDLGKRQLRSLSAPGGVEAVSFSPNGQRVAWLENHGTLTLLNRVAVAPVAGGPTVDAAAGLDGTYVALVWAGDDALVALETARTRTAVVRLRADGSGAEKLAGVADKTVLEGLSVDASGGRFVTLAQSATTPREPAWFDGSGKSGVFARPNDVSGWSLGSVEVFAWKGPGGAKLDGVLTLPPGATGPVPLMVYPHGGPDGVSQESFDAWAKYFAGRGYAVFRPNYRGGVGYGFAFYAANRGKLGRIEFGDIESGVDALVASGRVDRSRLVYGGWSWGGYLTAWTIGHTDRYRAAVAGAAVVDVVSQYALSDVNHGVAAQWEFQGDPWRDPQKFAAANPMASLHRAVTPTLVLHGLADERVGYTSSVILHRALLDLGCEVELYAYPGEPHGFEDPRHVIHLLEAWTGWYDRHTGAR